MFIKMLKWLRCGEIENDLCGYNEIVAANFEYKMSILAINGGSKEISKHFSIQHYWGRG